jgi:hypothetical protein
MTRLRAVLVVVGVAGMGFAALGLLTDPGVRLGGVLVFLVAVLVLHDGVWMPLVLAAGRVTGGSRIRGLLLCGASLTVVGLPLASGPGGTPYARNLALLLGALIVAGLIRAAVRKKLESPPGDPGG